MLYLYAAKSDESFWRFSLTQNSYFFCIGLLTCFVRLFDIIASQPSSNLLSLRFMLCPSCIIWLNRLCHRCWYDILVLVGLDIDRKDADMAIITMLGIHGLWGSYWLIYDCIIFFFFPSVCSMLVGLQLVVSAVPCWFICFSLPFHGNPYLCIWGVNIISKVF